MSQAGWRRDPATPSLLLFAALTVGGFVAIGIGWQVAARTLFVPAQIPALVSGAMGGLAMILLGVGLISIQSGRRLAAIERQLTETLLDEAALLVQAATGLRP